MTSLMAIQLKSRLEQSLGRPLRSTLVFSYPTVEAIVDYLAAQLFAPAPAPSSPPPEPAPASAAPAPPTAAIEQLTEDEAEALLAEKLAAFEKRI